MGAAEYEMRAMGLLQLCPLSATQANNFRDQTPAV